MENEVIEVETNDLSLTIREAAIKGAVSAVAAVVVTQVTGYLLKKAASKVGELRAKKNTENATA